MTRVQSGRVENNTRVGFNRCGEMSRCCDYLIQLIQHNATDGQTNVAQFHIAEHSSRILWCNVKCTTQNFNQRILEISNMTTHMMVYVLRMGSEWDMHWTLNKCGRWSKIGCCVGAWQAGSNWIKLLYPLNADLNPICHLLALLGAHHIIHFSRVRVKWHFNPSNAELNQICHPLALLGAHHILHVSRIRVKGPFYPLNAELNPICHLLALLGAHHILHVSRIRVKGHFNPLNTDLNLICHLLALLGAHHILHVSRIRVKRHFNPLNAELNPICHLLTLLGAHHILHVSRVRVKGHFNTLNAELNQICHLLALIGDHHILHVSRIMVKEELHLFASQRGEFKDDVMGEACETNGWRKKYWIFVRKSQLPVDTNRAKIAYCLHSVVLSEDYLNRRTGNVEEQFFNIVIYNARHGIYYYIYWMTGQLLS